MPTISIPTDAEHPEHWAVVQELLKAGGHEVGRIVRLHGAGDPAAERVNGVPCETAIYLTPDDRPRTAVRVVAVTQSNILQSRTGTWRSWPGWVAPEPG